MFRSAACAVGLLLVAAMASPATSPDPRSLAVSAEQEARAKELIRQLGSDSYRERDRATRELRQMGRLALTALADAAGAEDDPEVKARVEELLPAAEAEDMAARVAAFLADADGKFTHDLPGWDAFREAAGDDAPARALFAEAVKNPDNHPLLIALPAADERLRRAVAARRQQVYYRLNGQVLQVANGRPIRREMPSVPDTALLVLGEALVPDQPGPVGVAAGGMMPVSTLVQQPASREAAAGKGPFAAAYRKLVVRWLDTREGPNGTWTAYQLAINLQLGNPEIARRAAKLLTTEGVMASMKVSAMREMAMRGGKDNLPDVTRQFADETYFVRNQANIAGGGIGVAVPGTDDIQVRDAALAMAALLTGQDPTAYGMAGVNPNPAQNRYNPSGYAFRKDDKQTAEAKRDAAFKRWAEWEAKQAKP